MTQTSTDIVIDPMLVLTAVPHLGITLGPSFNLGVDGSIDDGKESVAYEASSYGFSAGLTLFF